MRDGGVDGQHDRRHFRRRAKPKIDPRDIAVRSPLLQQLDHPTPDANGRFRMVVAFSLGHDLGVEQKKQVDIRRIVELAAAKLSKCDDRHALRGCTRDTFCDRGFHGALDRFIGEVRQMARSLLEAQFSGQVAKDEKGNMSAGPIEEQTRWTVESLRRILQLEGADLSDIVRVTVYLEDTRDFGRYNKVFAEYFPDGNIARTTVEARAVIDTKIEMDAIAYKPLA